MMTVSFMGGKPPISTYHKHQDTKALRHKEGRHYQALEGGLLCVLVPLCLGVLSQVEVDFDVQRDIDRHAVAHAGPEAPLFERLDGIFIETEPEAAHDPLDIDCAITPHNRFENHGSLIPCLAGFFRVLRLDALNDRRWSDAAADTEHAAAGTAAFAGSHAGAFAFTNAASLAVSDTAANARPGRRRSWNTIRVAQVQQIDMQLRELRGNNRRLHDQLRIGILWRLRIRRSQLFVC